MHFALSPSNQHNFMEFLQQASTITNKHHIQNSTTFNHRKNDYGYYTFIYIRIVAFQPKFHETRISNDTLVQEITTEMPTGSDKLTTKTLNRMKKKGFSMCNVLKSTYTGMECWYVHMNKHWLVFNQQKKRVQFYYFTHDEKSKVKHLQGKRNGRVQQDEK